jgi:hypothetical protein
MNRYYVLLALPPLALGVKPEISFAELEDTLLLNLTPQELKKVSSLFEMIDLYNIKAFWLQELMDEKGNLQGKNLEEALLTKEDLPFYVVDYLEKYESEEDLINHFPELMAAFYREKAEHETGFLKEFFSFERKLKLLSGAIRAKELKRDIAKELQYEDPMDETVAFILAQKDASDFFLPAEFEKLKIVFVENSRDPEKLNHALLQYRFEKIEELEEKIPPFSLDQVLAYVAKFLIVQSFLEEGKWEKGRRALDELSKYG